MVMMESESDCDGGTECVMVKGERVRVMEVSESDSDGGS